MNILALTRENSACDYHRVELPMKYLPKEEGDNYTQALEHGKTEIKLSRDCAGQDYIWFSRDPSFEFNKLNKGKAMYYYRMVMDIDDYWELPVNHVSYGSWKNANMTERLQHAMKNSDMVFTTNDRLANMIIKIYNSKVFVLPNALPFGKGQFIEDLTEKRDRITFIYAGGSSHLYDVKSIQEVFLRLKSDVKFKNNAEFIMGFYDASGTYANATYNIIANSGAMAPPKVKRSVTEYMTVYNGCHVAIAPLEDTKFNSCKSNLKVLEAGCKKMPLIASKVYPYLEDECMDGTGLFLCESTSDWIDAVKYFVDNPEKIKQMGDALHAYVREKYNLEDVNKKRLQIFKSAL